MIAEQLKQWGFVPTVVLDVFGTDDGDEIERAINTFCEGHLRSGVAAHEFFDASVGSVHGVRLEDGRRVVLKASRPGTRSEFLIATQTVQSHLRAHGFPCPTPLLGPNPLGVGVAVVESYLDVGDRGDPHEPELRLAMAATLAHLVELCRPLGVLDALRRDTSVSEARLWPEPHDARFDFEGTTRGAEWIDALAIRASVRLQLGGPQVIGHSDWRAENVRFAEGKVVAVYDWDSLRVLSERLVGSAAHYFTSDFRVEGRRQLPSVEEAIAFIADYEAARGVAFNELEHQAAKAALVYAMAYGARCEHSDAVTDFGRSAPTWEPERPFPEGSARAFLARHAAELL